LYKAADFHRFGEFQTRNQAFPIECMFLILLKKDASNMYIIARTAGGLDLAAIDINPREPSCKFLFCSAALLNYEKIFKAANFNYKLLRK
jgi:hypothetical protein